MMSNFLQIVASDIFHKFNNQEEGFSGLAIIFPNRRARIFFEKYLGDCSTLPIWSPSYLTISDLFQTFSSLRISDTESLICKLYKIYKEETGSNETLDSFWNWGELMLQDFDDIDREIVNVKALFSSLDEESLMHFGNTFLSEKQQESLKDFFLNFSVNRHSLLKERYVAIWSVLEKIYNRLREELLSENIAYEGLLQKEVAQTILTKKLTFNKYIFIGFNYISKAEKLLFSTLRDQERAVFYWDYDTGYIDNPYNEAGRFIRQNLKDFPNQLKDESYFTTSKLPLLTIASSSTDNIQARYISQWIETIDGDVESDTAVVLCDSALLQPVLRSIPSNRVEHMNVTMGYPLHQTSLYTLIQTLLDLQSSFASESGKYNINNVRSILLNPLVDKLVPEAENLLLTLIVKKRLYPSFDELNLNEVLGLIFSKQRDNLSLLKYLLNILELLAPLFYDAETSSENTLNQESLYLAYTKISRLSYLVEKGELTLQFETLRRLLTRMLSTVSIPFSGEPAMGMQIMGILETRNLDFRNILLLSASDDFLPSKTTYSSFIPHTLRSLFGMTTIQDRNAVVAYNFYHLLQRAERVTLVYNKEASASRNGQPSRFILQLMAEWPEPIERVSLQSSININRQDNILIQKTAPILEKMCQIYDYPSRNSSYLSPSELKKYLRCPLMFYFSNIERIKPIERLDGSIDSRLFGTLFHKSIELVYHHLIFETDSGVINKESIKNLLSDSTIVTSYVDKAFKELYLSNSDISVSEYNGIQMINREVISRYIMKVLSDDKKYAPYRYLASEADSYKIVIEIPHPLDKSKVMGITLGGLIDRIDSKNGIIRIVDYKTGNPDNMSKISDQLFSINHSSITEDEFQVFYYALILSRQKEYKNKKLAPFLIYTRAAGTQRDESEYLTINRELLTDFSKYLPEYNENLKKVIVEIFNGDIPFTQTSVEKNCKYCDYKSICKR